MRVLSLVKILDYYDVPQVLIAKDCMQSKYLCMLYSYSDDGECYYLSVRLTEDRLENFLKGLVDLRTVLRTPEMENCLFVAKYNGTSFIAEAIEDANVTEEMLPQDGYYYEYDEEAENVDLLRLTADNQETIIRLAFEDPNNRHEIGTDCLAQAVTAFQGLVRNCCNKISGRSEVNSKLSVIALQAASFDVVFKTNTSLDLFGASSLSPALSAVHSLFSASDEDSLVGLIRKFNGHTISSYTTFLKVLKENNLSFRYKYVPSLLEGTVVSNYVPLRSIDWMKTILDQNSELSEEKKTYSGVFLASSVENGKWSIKCDEDENGRVNTIGGESETKDLLSGVTIEKQRYTIECKEIQVQHISTQKIVKKLILTSVKPL